MMVNSYIRPVKTVISSYHSGEISYITTYVQKPQFGP